MIRSIKRAAFVGGTPVAAAVAVFFSAANAFAQDANANANVGVGATATLPPRQVTPVATAAVAPVAANEHDMWVGHLAVGYYGARNVPTGPGMNATGAAAAQQTPVVGVRYWFTSMVGMDLGLGFWNRSSSFTTTSAAGSVTVNNPTFTTFVIHGGVPIALADAGHFSFQIIPEFDVGFGSGTQKNMAPTPNTDFSGFLLRAGARVGAEIYFGFVGIPQLALEGSVGAHFVTTSGKATTGPNSSKTSNTEISTGAFSSPWDIFHSSVAARYYF
jgi:hypothetical protein